MALSAPLSPHQPPTSSSPPASTTLLTMSSAPSRTRRTTRSARLEVPTWVLTLLTWLRLMAFKSLACAALLFNPYRKMTGGLGLWLFTVHSDGSGQQGNGVSF